MNKKNLIIYTFWSVIMGESWVMFWEAERLSSQIIFGFALVISVFIVVGGYFKLTTNQTGKWIEIPYFDEHYGRSYECSACGAENIGTTNYCSNCGAKMEEEK